MQPLETVGSIAQTVQAHGEYMVAGINLSCVNCNHLNLIYL